MTRIPVTAALLAIMVHVLVVDRAAPQSLTAGEVTGVVESGLGTPLGDVQVTLRRVDGSLPVATVTDQDGLFLATWLSPGEYELRAERLGFEPVVLSPIPVHVDRRLTVRVTLERIEGAVEAPRRVEFAGGPMASASRPGRSRVFAELELWRVPQRTGELADLTRLSSQGEDALEVEGLPSWTGRFVVGGVPFRPATLGYDLDPVQPTLVAPLLSLQGAELHTGRPDVEWPGAAGGVLAAALRAPPSGFGGTIAGVGSGGGLVIDDVEGVEPEVLRGGLLVGGSMLSDSAGGWVFAEVQQRSTPAFNWPVGAEELGSALGDAGVDVTPLSGERVGSSDRINLGGRFEWRLAGGAYIDLFALYGQGEGESLRTPTGLDVPATADFSDLLAGATFAASFTDRLSGQVRVGFSRSERAVDPRLEVDTGLGAATVVFGPSGARIGDPVLDSEATRSEIVVDGALYHRSGPNLVKGGLGVSFARHDHSVSFDRATTYVFADAEGFTAERGAFTGLDGRPASADFSRAEYFAYVQNSWRATRGLDLTTGLRLDLEGLPQGDLRTNDRWEALTGIDNAGVDQRRATLGLVAGFEWDIEDQHLWHVLGSFTIQQGDIPAALLVDALRYDGRVTATGAVGDVTDPVDLGPPLTVLAPELQPAVTTRASLGISRAIGSGVIQVGGVLRETDNLPGVADVNLPVDAPFADQYGRPVFGALVREGPLLYAEPNANRRFAELGAVTAVSSASTSTYWGVTAGLEKRFGVLQTATSYTYSRTSDDWFAAGTAPAPRVEEDWLDGTSDFDVPHRLTTAAELGLPFLPGVRIGALWQRSSGRPFTPGYGRAVDANGDGVAGNDPAFVDAGVSGIGPLLSEWSCLDDDVGDFIERNACRGPTRTLLDGWLTARFPIAGVATELRVEALGLVAEGVGFIDETLYRLDPDAAVVARSDGVIEVPVVANDGFGSELGGGREVSRIRISLRMEF